MDTIRSRQRRSRMPSSPQRRGYSDRGSWIVWLLLSSLLFIISILPDCQALDKPLCETKCKIYSDRILRDSADRGEVSSPPSLSVSLSPSEVALDRCNILSITLAAVAEIASWHCGNMSAEAPCWGVTVAPHVARPRLDVPPPPTLLSPLLTAIYKCT